MSEKIARAALLLACAAMAEQATEHELAPDKVADLADAQLVDVRTPAEYEASRIEGARHITLDELETSAGQLDKQRPLVFYCRTGERSAMAADAFRASGWDAYSVGGGLVAWAEQGLPLEPEGAEVAQHSSIPSP
jgi:rhodanese-related sulfurtransferase